MISKLKFPSLNPQQLIPQMTALWILFNMTEVQLTYMPLRVLACILLLFPKLTLNFRYWLLITLAYVLYLSNDFINADNHRWLFLYWLIGLLLSIWNDDKKSETFSDTIKKSSVLLLITSFSLAFLWKAFNPAYLDSSFFEYILAGGDNRLQDFVIGGLRYDPQEIKYNTYLVQNIIRGENIQAYQSPLFITSPLRITAQLFTWYALIIEFIIPILYLISLKKIEWRRYASYSVILFILSVYFITPVFGFGQILALLGLAANERKEDEKLFVGAFILMIILNVPWFSFTI
jgi:hypothetical protein